MALSGKVVVITGASSGIGAHLAKICVDRGARVMLAARRTGELENICCSLGGNDVARFFQCDVTIRDNHASLLKETIDRFEKIDCWVNNAGVGMSRPVIDVTDDDFDMMMLINTKSVLYGMQTIVPYYKDIRKGQVINVSSLLGRVPFASYRAMYSASKAAMNSLTCNMRVDLKNSGYNDIHISLVSPGVVATDFGTNAIGGGPDSRTFSNAQPVEEVAALIADMIAYPRADVYSRPAYKAVIAGYYSSDDVAVVEAGPPFTGMKPAASSTDK